MSKNIEGVSVALPFVYDKIDGPYRLNKDLSSAVKQNLKTLLLTSPGERIMIPQFGVGLRNFLFEGISSQTYERLTFKIQEQIDLFLPFIELETISFVTSDA